MKYLEDYTEDELLELKVQKYVKASLMAGHKPTEVDINNLRNVLSGKADAKVLLKQLIEETKANAN